MPTVQPQTDRPQGRPKKRITADDEAELTREAYGSLARDDRDARDNAIAGSARLLERLQMHHGHNE